MLSQIQRKHMALPAALISLLEECLLAFFLVFAFTTTTTTTRTTAFFTTTTTFTTCHVNNFRYHRCKPDTLMPIVIYTPTVPFLQCQSLHL